MKKLTTAWAFGLGCALAFGAPTDEAQAAYRKRVTGCLES